MTRSFFVFCWLMTTTAFSYADGATDPSRCYSIKDADLRQSCLAETRNNKGTCYSIKDADRRQLCLAQTTGQKSICYNIKDKDKKAACLAGMGFP